MSFLPSSSKNPTVSNLPSQSGKPSVSRNPSVSFSPSLSNKPSTSGNPTGSAAPSVSYIPSTTTQPSSFYDRFTTLVKTVTDETDFNNPNSFQTQALDCIVTDDLVLDKTVTDKYLLQRYAMVVLSFSFCGTCADFAFDWDRMSTECDWSNIECNINAEDVRNIRISKCNSTKTWF